LRAEINHNEPVSALGIPVAVRLHAQRVADDYRALTGVPVDADQLLTGRAALLGLTPNGRISAGGATRLMPAEDGWCAVTLSRPDDIDAVPALVECDTIPDDPWPVLQHWARGRDAAAVTARARLLGLPAAALGETSAAPPRVRPLGRPGSRPLPEVMVADLSSMWAGPLCGQLLARAGATVVKVESAARPDGTRAGEAAFFDWMNSGKLSYAVDFEPPGALRALLAAADVVIEASRPGALVRQGLGPMDIAPRNGRVWVRITGHGTDGERADWVAFGDDAAVSGGLVGVGPVFVGDAIADPLTGLHAARAVVESLRRRGGELIELSLAAVAAGYAELPGNGEKRCPLTPPPAPRVAPSLGADNAVVEQLVADRLVASC
jgi:hypothetical protein